MLKNNHFSNNANESNNIFYLSCHVTTFEIDIQGLVARVYSRVYARYTLGYILGYTLGIP